MGDVAQIVVSSALGAILGFLASVRVLRHDQHRQWISAVAGAAANGRHALSFVSNPSLELGARHPQYVDMTASLQAMIDALSHAVESMRIVGVLAPDEHSESELREASNHLSRAGHAINAIAAFSALGQGGESKLRELQAALAESNSGADEALTAIEERVRRNIRRSRRLRDLMQA